MLLYTYIYAETKKALLPLGLSFLFKNYTYTRHTPAARAASPRTRMDRSSYREASARATRLDANAFVQTANQGAFREYVTGDHEHSRFNNEVLRYGTAQRFKIDTILIELQDIVRTGRLKLRAFCQLPKLKREIDINTYIFQNHAHVHKISIRRTVCKVWKVR